MKNCSPAHLASVILAAGKGTRMQSDLPKVLHNIANKEMLAYVIEAAEAIGSVRIIVVVGFRAALVRDIFKNAPVVFVEQAQQLGTAHAVVQASSALADFDGNVLILCGDVPLLRKETLQELVAYHQDNHADVTVMTAILAAPGSYGRVVRNSIREVLKIVEFGDASDAERAICEINTGIYCVSSRFLLKALPAISSNDNQQGEYYLTDIIAVAKDWGKRACAFVLSEPSEAMGINSLQELAFAEQYLLARSQK